MVPLFGSSLNFQNTSTAATPRIPKSIPAIPKLPKGKKMLETVVSKDVDSLYRSIFENETFFEIVTKKTYDDVKNFGVTAWNASHGNGNERRRKMAFEFPKTIAFSRHEIRMEQVNFACYTFDDVIHLMTSQLALNENISDVMGCL